MALNLIDRRFVRHIDWPLLTLTLAIPCLSLLVLYSAGYDPDNDITLGFLPFSIKSYPFLKQSFFLIIGLIVLVIGASVPGQALHRYAYIFYGIGIALLTAVIFVGTVVNGSRRWIPLGAGLNIQPAELMKIGIIICLGRYLSRNPPRKNLYDFSQLIVPGLLILIPMALIMDQPDLGSALVVGAVGTMMVLFVGVRPRVILTLLFLGAVVTPLAWNRLHSYQQRRILTLLNPEADPRGSGYHITQSIIAVGSGELFGKGFMRGTQTQLEFLPEHTTDFIFSVLAEEWGFFGCSILITLFCGLIYRLYRASLRSKDPFSILVCFGVGTTIAFHATVNIGMVLGLMPVVGIPLPLFSYGGSAMLTLLLAIGIAAGLSMRRLVFKSGGM